MRRRCPDYEAERVRQEREELTADSLQLTARKNERCQNRREPLAVSRKLIAHLRQIAATDKQVDRWCMSCTD